MADKEQNRAMAKRMKDHYEKGKWIQGEARTHMRCPLCHKVISIDSQPQHLGQNHGFGSQQKE